MSVIACSNLTKTYQTGFLGRNSSNALTNLSFSVEKGDVFGIIGANGAGKSTLIKTVMGLVKQDLGSVKLFGLNPTIPESRKGVGYLPENPNLYNNLSLADHLRFAQKIHSKSNQFYQEKSSLLISQLNLTGKSQLPLKSYSKGMRQRAALAFTLFSEPQLLILDEPMSGLDPLGRQLMIDIIADCKRQGITILFCSHILTDIERVCDKIGILHNGKLVASTTPIELEQYAKTVTEELINRTPLEHMFLHTLSNL